MKKFIIQELLDGVLWDNYTGEVIEAETYDDAVARYKEDLINSGEFSEEEVESMKYRAGAMTKYVLRRDDDEKSYIKTYNTFDDALSQLETLGGEYCVEEVMIDLGSGEPLEEGKYYFYDDEIQSDDDYEEYGNYDGKEIHEY